MAMWRKDKETQPSAGLPAIQAGSPGQASLPGQGTAKPEALKPEAEKVEAKSEIISASPATNPSAANPPAAKSTETPAVAPAVTPAAVSAPPTQPVAKAPAASSAPKSAPNPLPSHIDTRIGSGLKIRGEITGTSDMYIDGDVQGKIRIGDGVLTIGSNGRVQADAEAREILVNGSIVGNLKASDRVQLGSTGSVQGGIITPRIGIEDGARLRGNVETARAGESRTTTESASGRNEVRAMAATQSKSE